MNKPGRELPKDYREVATHQVEAFGWRYDPVGRHPVLYPADRSQRPIPVPTTPGDHRSFKNFVAQVRRAGGQWPPGRD